MRYLNKITLSSLMLLTLFSCKKLIELPEEDLITEDVALVTVANNESAIIGAYQSTAIEMDILLNATFSDEVKVAEFYNAGTTHEWQYGSTDVGLRDNFTAVTPNYRTINRVNKVLDALPIAIAVNATDEALRSKLKGEALFLRAWSHFQLFRYYCANYEAAGMAMPYMDTSTIDPTPSGRIDMETFFDRINSDLTEAKGLVPDNLTNKSRVNKLTVSALQARIALYTRDWTNAITYATEYINAIPLSPRAQFHRIWNDSSSNEVSWRLERTANVGGRIGSLFRAISGKTGSTIVIGTVTWRPTDEIWGLYDQTNDVRFGAYFKDEPMLTATSRGSRLIAKYAGKTYNDPDENVAHAKVFRTAEMYLIRAEALAETGAHTGANSAESDINALRTARITGYTDVIFASKQDAMDAIILERQKELVYEGHRFWDLKRWGLPVTRTGSDAPTATAATLPANNFRFLLPIPNSEILANPYMEQNPGYN
jgi:starch-binding outer membrane protein, SusD/RagB family